MNQDTIISPPADSAGSREVEYLSRARRAEAAVEQLREVMQIIASQASGKVCSTDRVDCMAALAQAALRD